jgi:hypothetical protein
MPCVPPRLHVSYMVNEATTLDGDTSARLQVGTRDRKASVLALSMQILPILPPLKPLYRRTHMISGTAAEQLPKSSPANVASRIICNGPR